MGLNVVAEGVETKEQAEFLAQRQCNLLQGYFFYQPMPEERFLEVLAAGRSSAG